MHPSKIFLSAMAVLAQFTSAAPLERRATSLTQPFQILVRPVELSGPDVYEEPLYLSQPDPTSSQYAVAHHGNSSIFQLSDGVLSTPFPVTGVAVTWQNAPIQKGQFLEFKSESALKHAQHKLKITVTQGGAAALMAVGQDVYSWYFCTNKSDGSQLGLSVGKMPGKDIACNNVYAYVVPIVS